MVTSAIESLRSVRTTLIIVTMGAALAAMPATASAVTIMDDDFGTDTSANWTQSGGTNPPFFNTVNSYVNFTGTPTSIRHNITFDPSAGNSTITTAMYGPTGIGGFQQDTAVVAGIASSSSSAFMAVRAYAVAKTVSLTTSGGDFTVTTLSAFNTNGAVLTLNLFPVTSQYQVLIAAPAQAGPPGFDIPAVNYDSGLRSLTADVPGFSFAALGSSDSALLGSAAANSSANTRGVNIDRIMITQVVPSPAAAAVLGLGVLATRRRRICGAKAA